VTFLIILTLVGIIIYSYFFYRQRQKKEHQLLMQQKYEQYLLKLSFTDEELEMITKMTVFLESDQLKYHMLTNKPDKLSV